MFQSQRVESGLQVHLPSVIGRGYKSFWNWKGRYLVTKGSRGSKKSTTAALKIISNIMKMPGTHALVVRRYEVTHKDSTYAQLKWAVNRLGVRHLWKFHLSPLGLTYIPTGQKIMFRGLDDPQSLTSITVETGHICWVWIEEAYQVTNEEDFNKLDLSIRGELPKGLYKQLILTFNPWDSRHWLKERFFDDPDGQTLSMTTNYLLNEFLGDDDRQIFETMKIKSPKRYEVEGLGNWGISEGVIFTNWRVENFNWKLISMETDNNYNPAWRHKFGLDFGFSTDPTAFIASMVNMEKMQILIYKEHYEHAMSNQRIVDALKQKEMFHEMIIADSEDPRTINELVMMGANRMKGAKKGPDSVRAGIQKLQDFEIIVHPSCEHTITELSNYVWDKDKFGKPTGQPAKDGYNHLIDGLRYSHEDTGSYNFSF